jgi:hypothetical protein
MRESCMIAASGRCQERRKSTTRTTLKAPKSCHRGPHETLRTQTPLLVEKCAQRQGLCRNIFTLGKCSASFEQCRMETATSSRCRALYDLSTTMRGRSTSALRRSVSRPGARSRPKTYSAVNIRTLRESSTGELFLINLQSAKRNAPPGSACCMACQTSTSAIAATTTSPSSTSTRSGIFLQQAFRTRHSQREKALLR